MQLRVIFYLNNLGHITYYEKVKIYQEVQFKLLFVTNYPAYILVMSLIDIQEVYRI